MRAGRGAGVQGRVEGVGGSGEAMSAPTSQPRLAREWADGGCANGPLIRSGDHLLHDRVRELCLLGCEVGRAVEHRVVAVGGGQQ